MPTGSEFHTEGAATLKPREAKVVWTRGTDNTLVLEERKEHYWRDVAAKQRVEVSRLRGVESVMSQCGKFEFNALVDGEPMKMLKDGG